MKFGEYIQTEGFLGDRKKNDAIFKDMKRSAYNAVMDKILDVSKKEMEKIYKKYNVNPEDTMRVDGLGSIMLSDLMHQMISDSLQTVDKPMIKDKRWK